MSTVSVGLVDDHPLMIEGIVTLLSRAHGIEVLSTGSTARDIIEISSRFRPDVIIVDLSMAGDVYAAIAMSIKISPNTKIVAFTAATGVDTRDPRSRRWRKRICPERQQRTRTPPGH